MLNRKSLATLSCEAALQIVSASLPLVSLWLLGGVIPALAHNPLQYHGGPVLSTFTIYPLYYGNWQAADITAQESYLSNLAAYLSGQNTPAGLQPMMKQYGVNQVSVAPYHVSGLLTLPDKPDPGFTGPDPCSAPTCLWRGDVEYIIQANQSAGRLPAYSSETLIVVFPAHGIGLHGCNGCGYHTSDSASAFWAVVPEDAGAFGELNAQDGFQLVTAHEVFEASADPSVNNYQGWDEAVDQCDNSYAISLSTIPIRIPAATDNTEAGACNSNGGYTRLDEIEVYGYLYADYRNEYNSLWPQGWRLYSLQSYVSNGQVLYNAVWRPQGNLPEIQVYGWLYADFKSEYDSLWPQGWRLYILQSYVLNGQVYYNAVWRQGNIGEIQEYGVTYSQYRSEYDSIWPQGWRLYILQSYVLNGQVYYNAVWRPGISPEIQVYGWLYSDYRAKYDSLWPQGWRLYSLQSYVLNGQVYYNAVWRPGTSAEIQVYGWQYSDFRNEYNTLWQQGWRLYILDSYVLNNQTLYNAVWRQGTLDRPL